MLQQLAHFFMRKKSEASVLSVKVSGVPLTDEELVQSIANAKVEAEARSVRVASESLKARERADKEIAKIHAEQDASIAESAKLREQRPDYRFSTLDNHRLRSRMNLPILTKVERAYLKLPPPQYARIQEVSIDDEAKLQAGLINELYEVEVMILPTDKEYYSDETLIKTIQDKVYFISQENPIKTSEITEVLIRQAKLRVELMHANRVEKSTQRSLSLSDKIKEIVVEFTELHNGKEPSLGKIAKILADREIESPRGGTKWYAETVKRVLDRRETIQKG